MGIFQSATMLLKLRFLLQSTSLGSVRWLQIHTASDLFLCAICYSNMHFLLEDLRSQLKELIPEQQVIGGMRGMIGSLWETSLLDPEEVRPRSNLGHEGSTKPRLRRARPLLVTSMTMLQRGACRNQLSLTAPFPIQDTFSRLADQGFACSSCHESPEIVPILKDDTLLLRLFVHPAANKRYEPRACSPHFLRKIRIKLHHPLPTNISKLSSCKRRNKKDQIITYQRSEKKESTRAAKVQAAFRVLPSSIVLDPQLRSFFPLSLSLFPFLNIVLALTATLFP
ncbi:Citrate synthase, mitochondrial [Apostasia shenzhenica]|uniref:Citrate synthase, mitochondrial n=1 Tax=Apostasia shenzhenica TaxID=1088818 RepID=A0A2I0AK12_9ASPA|nr:Citrate synthase, mitochondrial [Apostasia shenzhenica]